MRTSPTPAGATLAELLIVFSILALIGGMGMPRVRGAVDVYAARAGRDAAAAVFARAHSLALARGGARVIVDPATSSLRLEAPIGQPIGDPLRLADRLAVHVTIDNHGTAPVQLDFDALGIGRIANRTLRFNRGGAEARLTLSSFGRPRRW
jgi:hypothetical protein